MDAYVSLKEISKCRKINYRTIKKRIGIDIFEVKRNGKTVGYFMLDEIVLFVIEKLKGQNK